MNFVIKSTVFSFEPFALAVRRNDADFRLVADRVISDLSRSKKDTGYLRQMDRPVYRTTAAHFRSDGPA